MSMADKANLRVEESSWSNPYQLRITHALSEVGSDWLGSRAYAKIVGLAQCVLYPDETVSPTSEKWEYDGSRNIIAYLW